MPNTTRLGLPIRTADQFSCGLGFYVCRRIDFASLPFPWLFPPEPHQTFDEAEGPTSPPTGGPTVVLGKKIWRPQEHARTYGLRDVT